MKFHQDHVTDLSLHPISDYMLTTSKDKSWLFSDINTGKFRTILCVLELGWVLITKVGVRKFEFTKK